MKLLLTTIAAVVLVGCGPSMSIHEAAKTGNIEAVKHYLDTGTDVNLKDNEVGTPLHLAAIFSREVTELLIANGADVNAKDKYGGTPLDYANNEVAKILINNGAKTSDGLKVDERKLVAASRDGDIRKVKSYLAIGVDVNSIDEDGHTPLHWASYLGNKEIVEMLIKKDADINAKDNDRRTPLDRAKGKEIKSMLIQYGGIEGQKRKPPMSNFITNDPNLKSFYIQMAVEAGSIEAVKHYLKEGMDVNIRLNNLAAGDTLLHEAVYNGSMEIVKLLVSKGADLNLGSGGGMRDLGNIQMRLATDGSPLLPTPLDYAARYNRTDIADLLRKHGGKTAEELKAEGK